MSIQNWQETKEALLEGLQGTKRSVVSTLMENQQQYLRETAGATAVGVGAIANFQKIAIPMIRRILPGTIASDLVGVQPMTGPVGLVYSLRFAFGEDTNGAGKSSGINGDRGDDYTIAGHAGDEAFVNSSKMKRFYSSIGAGTTGYPPAGPTSSTGFGSNVGDFEGFGGRSMRLSVLKQSIESKIRKLQARWTIEAAQDLNSQHGLDLENELTAALSAQISQEIDNEILTDLLQLAGATATFDFAASSSSDYNPTYIGDRYSHLGVLVNKMANEIGAKTRRGPGNWLVGGHLITTILQSAAKSVFAPAVAGSFSDPTGNKLVGTMNGQIKVYSYNWGLNDEYTVSGSGTGVVNAAGDLGEDILLGYKGGSSELDTGFFFCPHIPLMSTGMVMDANTFSPAVSLMTRYAKATFVGGPASGNLGHSNDYYARILVKNVAFS